MANPGTIDANAAKSLTIKGRLSWPRFTHAEAVEANKKSNFPKADESKVSPEFNLLVERDQLDKIIAHIRDVMIPYVQQQTAAGEKRDVLDDKVVKKILKKLEDEDWDGAPHLPIKPLTEKNAESMPSAVASIKVTGRAGSDIKLLAKVTDNTQLAVVDPDIIGFPLMKPIKETVFEMYPGAWVATTMNLYAFVQSTSVNGISAGGDICVYLGDLDGDRFGGGAQLDEDAIFMLD